MNWKMKAMVLLCLMALSCKQDKAFLVNPAVDCDTISVHFTNDIAPLFEATCATGLGGGTGCHDSWASDYNVLSSKAKNGRLERYVIFEKSMPPTPNAFNIRELTDDEINKVHCWLIQGAPNN